MTTSDYHAKYFAHALTTRFSSEKLEKLSESLLNATVDLNPHQVEAAVFAFRSPFSNGAILADEVGLGKTIEAGLVLSQLWAERRRRILIIVPTPLRTQWRDELLEKFGISSQILDATSYRRQAKTEVRPFETQDVATICSYQFARNKLDDIQLVAWDLVIIDEAHRLRNVYKKDSRIARALLEGLSPYKKILLTATPLQNNLLELFGLSKFVDPQLFGDDRAFRNLATRITADEPFYLQQLRDRIQSICHRTLRRQVSEYVPFTARIAITQDFIPYEDEARLYSLVSEFLRRPGIMALGGGQRHLITMVFRKLLASSSFAISETLNRLTNRLSEYKTDLHGSLRVSEDLQNEYETISETDEEWSDGADSSDASSEDSENDKLAKIEREIQEIKNYYGLASGIKKNAKGDALLSALKHGFSELDKLGAPPKAVIFTESKRTQAYLKELLTANGFAGQIATINGTNDDPESQEILNLWLEKRNGQNDQRLSRTAEIRAAIVEHFRNHASILIATEAGAEGLNLQFAALVVNFDLPWNPQRIEQRIGRCHRYGQKYDVVVINFLNRTNAADVRVFELLSQKFRLFEGLFGASDDVLGALESGVDFEKRVSEIYQNCRTEQEINQAFNDLQHELEPEITARFADTRIKLIEHFDEEVHERLRINREQTLRQISKMEEWLWQLTQHELKDFAHFDSEGYQFELKEVPGELSETVNPGSYILARKEVGDGKGNYRLAHPLAQWAINSAKSKSLPSGEVILDYGNHPTQISTIASLVGKTGTLSVRKITIAGLDTEDHLICTCITDEGVCLDDDTCTRLLSLAVVEVTPLHSSIDMDKLNEESTKQRDAIIESVKQKHRHMFEQEVDKLDGWAEDLKTSLELQLAELDAEIRSSKKQSHLATELEQKLSLRRAADALEKQRNRKRKEIFAAQDDIEKRRDQFIEAMEKRLHEQTVENELFTVRWKIV